MNSRIIPIFLVFISIGIFFWYVSPEWNGAIAQKKAAIAAADEELTATQQYVEQEQKLADARDAISKSDLATLETFLPDSVSNVTLILDLNALAARTGLSIGSADVSGVSSSNNLSGQSIKSSTTPVGSVDLSLSAAGTYTALEAFLRGVEQSNRLLDVKELTITGSDSGVYQYQMKISIYWLH